jgi:hypothetical protein
MGWMFGHASSFNHELIAWNVSRVTSMYAMFYYASSFNQDLCPWGDILTFPYENVNAMFWNSGCTYQSSPIRASKGPFCASDDCIASESPLSYATDGDNWGDDNLYSNSNKSQNKPIANESHQVSVQATALASSSGPTKTKAKPSWQICSYAGTNKCPTVPGKQNTAPSCRCENKK